MRLVESLRGVGIFNPVNRRGNRPRFRIVTSVYPSSLGGGGDQLPLFLDVRSARVNYVLHLLCVSTLRWSSSPTLPRVAILSNPA